MSVTEYLELLFIRNGAGEDSGQLEILASDPSIHNRAMEYVAGKMERDEELTKAELAFRVNNPAIYSLFTKFRD